jgi:hypothetical protein
MGVALGSVAVAFSWWQGGLTQSSAAAHIGVLAAIAAVLGSALFLGVGRQAATTARWIRGPLSVQRHMAEDRRATLAVVVWIVLVLAVVGWDLNSFVHQSHDLPTLSSIFGHVTASHGGRAAVVALWLALGTALAVGWRRPR